MVMPYSLRLEERINKRNILSQIVNYDPKNFTNFRSNLLRLQNKFNHFKTPLSRDTTLSPMTLNLTTLRINDTHYSDTQYCRSAKRHGTQDCFFVIMIVSELSVVAPHFITSYHSMRRAYIIAA